MVQTLRGLELKLKDLTHSFAHDKMYDATITNVVIDDEKAIVDYRHDFSDGDVRTDQYTAYNDRRYGEPQMYNTFKKLAEVYWALQTFHTA